MYTFDQYFGSKSRTLTQQYFALLTVIDFLR